MSSTEFDKKLKDKAKEFKDLIEGNMAPFDDLVHRWPQAGSFSLGVWVERVLDDRRNAIVAHAAHLKTAFAEMSVALYSIAENFDEVDDSNAKDVKKIFDESKTSSEEKMNVWNTAREEAEGNLAGTDLKPGDGYAQNVNNAFDSSGGNEKKV